MATEAFDRTYCRAYPAVCTEMTPFERGEAAFRRGVEIMDCPYEDTTEAAEWHRGWSAARDRAMRSPPLPV